MLLYLFFDSLLSTCQKKWKLKNYPRPPTLPYIFIYMYNSLKTITAVLIREAWKGKPQKSTLKCSFSITNQSVTITFQGSVTFIKHRVLKVCGLKIRGIKIYSVQAPNSQVYGDEINVLFERLYNASQRRHWEIISFKNKYFLGQTRLYLYISRKILVFRQIEYRQQQIIKLYVISCLLSQIYISVVMIFFRTVCLRKQHQRFAISLQSFCYPTL